jgi:TRAP-type C4-dicarboxylate transport system substrate-binding protein
MKNSKHLWTVVAVLFVFGTLALFPIRTTASEKIEWKMATTSPQGHYMSQRYVVPFANKVREDSGGRLDIKIFYIGQLPYDGADYLRVVKERNLDVALAGLREVVGDVPVTGVFNLPFFFHDVDQVQAAAKALRPIFNREFGKYSTKLLYFAEAQTIQVINKKVPLQSMDGFKGLKLRVLGPEPGDALKALGAVPVSIALAEMYTSMQRGVIDGALTNEGSALGAKLYEVCKYYTILNFHEFMTFTFVNLNSFNALPPDLQKIVMDAAAWNEQNNFGAIRKETEEDRATLKQKGVEFLQMPPAELDKIRKKVSVVIENWVKKDAIHKETYDKALEVIKKSR